MIYTVTFNPSLDYVVHMPRFAAGAINRAEQEHIYPGGKGINVALVLGSLHTPARMLGFTAGFTGREIERLCRAHGGDCGYIGKLHAEVPMKNDPDNPGNYVSSRRPEWDAYTPPSRRHGFNYWYSYGTFDVHRNPHYWDTEGKRHDPHEFSVKHETDKAISSIMNRGGERDPRKPFCLCVA